MTNEIRVEPKTFVVMSLLDSLVTMHAHESTLVRKEISILPIAGSQVTCDNSNLCAYLSDILGTKYPGEFDIKYYAAALYNYFYGGGAGLPYIEAFLQYLKSAADHITAQVNTTVNDLGTPGGGETVFGDLSTLKADANTIEAAQTYQNDTFLQPILNALPYPNSQATNVHADINRAIADILLGNALSTLIQEAVGTIASPLGYLLQTIVALFPNHSGGNTNVNYNECLINNFIAPPLSSLTVLSPVSLGAGASIDLPAGCYGIEFAFTVPSYWAKRGTFAYDLDPSIAVIDWRHTGISFDNPKYVRQESFIQYPLLPGADQFTIDLATGISGTYALIVLP